MLFNTGKNFDFMPSIEIDNNDIELGRNEDFRPDNKD